MNRIHAINAGLSFFGLLSVTGYTEVGTLSMGTSRKAVQALPA